MIRIGQPTLVTARYGTSATSASGCLGYQGRISSRRGAFQCANTTPNTCPSTDRTQRWNRGLDRGRPYVSLLGAILMLCSLLWVTGIPFVEQQSLRSRGDAYRDYQRRVSVFVPWFPRQG